MQKDRPGLPSIEPRFGSLHSGVSTTLQGETLPWPPGESIVTLFHPSDLYGILQRYSLFSPAHACDVLMATNLWEQDERLLVWAHLCVLMTMGAPTCPSLSPQMAPHHVRDVMHLLWLSTFCKAGCSVGFLCKGSPCPSKGPGSTCRTVAWAASSPCPFLDRAERSWTIAVWDAPSTGPRKSTSMLLLLPSIPAVSQPCEQSQASLVGSDLMLSPNCLHSGELDTHLLLRNQSGDQESLPVAEAADCSSSSSLWTPETEHEPVQSLCPGVLYLERRHRITSPPDMAGFWDHVKAAATTWLRSTCKWQAEWQNQKLENMALESKAEKGLVLWTNQNGEICIL